MFISKTWRIKRFFTNETNKTTCFMNQLVPIQVTLGNETFATRITFKWPLAEMFLFVHLHVTTLTKALPTNITFMRLLSFRRKIFIFKIFLFLAIYSISIYVFFHELRWEETATVAQHVTSTSRRKGDRFVSRSDTAS